MKRWLFTILIFLLLGAVVNVGVAWGHSAWKQPQIFDQMMVTMKNRWAYPPREGDVPPYLIDDPAKSFIVVQSGWPCRGLERKVVSLDAEEGRRRFGYTTGLVLSNRVCLPLRPAWPEFGVNTMLFAAPLWLLVRGPCRLRVFVRARHGRCPACGYPIGVSPQCSECGRDVARWVKDAEASALS